MKNLTFLLEAIPSPPKHWFFYLMNFYPPYLGAGVRVHKIEPDWSAVEVSLKLRWWNRNYLGTQFGGSIYSMCDPFHLLILMELLGPDYIVRDKGAEVRFLKKGLGRLTARFAVDSKTVAEIWNNPEDVQEKKFLVSVRNDAGEVVAEILKVLHIRRKPGVS